MSVNQASPSDIKNFLVAAKTLLANGDYVFMQRHKNLQDLADHGMTIDDVKNEIFSLIVGNYHKGPKKDFDPNQPGDIWEFKKSIDGKQFYVKLKIQEQNDGKILKCISFHEDEFPT